MGVATFDPWRFVEPKAGFFSQRLPGALLDVVGAGRPNGPLVQLAGPQARSRGKSGEVAKLPAAAKHEDSI